MIGRDGGQVSVRGRSETLNALNRGTHLVFIGPRRTGESVTWCQLLVPPLHHYRTHLHPPPGLPGLPRWWLQELQPASLPSSPR